MYGAYRGVVRDGKVVLCEQQPPLTEGTEVFVTPLVPGTEAKGDVPPFLPTAWVDDLVRMVARSKRTPISPELYKQLWDELPVEEVLARVEKLKAGDGQQLHEFIDRLERAAAGHE
jgi:hypothetical protein